MASLSPLPRYDVLPKTAAPKTVSKTTQIGTSRFLTSTEKVKWLFTILFCAVLGIFIVSQYSYTAKINLEVGQDQIDIQKLSTSNQSLKDQVARLSNPALLLKIATEKLHMIPASESANKGTTP